jgi:hypothetical protein
VNVGPSNSPMAIDKHKNEYKKHVTDNNLLINCKEQKKKKNRNHITEVNKVLQI